MVLSDDNTIGLNFVTNVKVYNSCKMFPSPKHCDKYMCPI